MGALVEGDLLGIRVGLFVGLLEGVAVGAEVGQIGVAVPVES